MSKLALLLLFISIGAQAEYRVFTLVLKNSQTQVTRQIDTTLDPEQYMTIYPLGINETLAYVDTWMCKGRTDFFRPHCDKPIKPLARPNPAHVPVRSPASFQPPGT